jgi:hypothetical protein
LGTISRHPKNSLNPIFYHRTFASTNIIVDKDFRSGDSRIAQKNSINDGPTSKLGGLKRMIVASF